MKPPELSRPFPAAAWTDWWRGTIPGDASDLGRIAATAPEPSRRLRVVALRNFTIEPLEPYLRTAARLLDVALDLEIAPPGLLHEAAGPEHPLWNPKPDVVWLALNPGELVDAARTDASAHLRDLVDGLLKTLRTHWHGPVVIGLLPDPDAPGAGPERPPDWAAPCRTLPGVRLLDWDATLTDVGRRRFFDARLWDAVHYPFSAEGAAAVTRDVAHALATVLEAPVKCVVVDADDTLWGGLAGEEGLEAVVLSGARGAPYRALQRRLLALKSGGVLLALATKNNPADVYRILDRHPAMVLRRGDFAAIRASWDPKPESLRSIAAELGFGLDTFVFLDDSPFERAAVAEELPAVRVPGLPESPAVRPAFLDAHPALHHRAATGEDLLRAGDVSAGGAREALRQSATTHADYLAGLGITMRIRIDHAPGVARLAQLCARTNQFHCATRRHTEPEIARRIAAPDWLVADFALSDRFGDQGVTGAAMAQIQGTTARLDTLLVSCRVFGRRAEHAFLAEVAELLRARGVETIVIDFEESDRNRIAREFLESVAAPAPGNPGRYELRTPIDELRQAHIRVERGEPDTTAP